MSRRRVRPLPGRTLVLAAHLPPAVGGVATFTAGLLDTLDPASLVVLAPSTRGAARHDRGLPYPVVRVPRAAMPVAAPRLARELGCRRAWMPAAAPWGLLAPRLRDAGVEHVVASTHGQEVGWLRTPALAGRIAALAAAVDVLTYLGPATRDALVAGLTGHAAPRCVLRPLAGGVDPRRFPRRPSRGVPGPPTAVTTSRLTPRKGLVGLLRCWPAVRARVPGAVLVVAGAGPLGPVLTGLRDALGLRDGVRLVGRLPHAAHVALLHRARVFVSPSTTLCGGRLLEGLGLSVLEASATGLPVVVGDSGGSGAALVPGRTGLLVDTFEPDALADAVAGLLLDPVRADRMGAAGAAWAREAWGWDRAGERLAAYLEPGASDGDGDPWVPKMVW